MDSGKHMEGRKPEIPAIKSAAADRKQPEVSARNIEFSKVISLLKDSLTTNLKEKHVFVLKKILKRNSNGFLLKDLNGLATIFDICAQKSLEDAMYLPFLCEAITLCRLPFLKERVSDELTYAQDVSNLLSQIGYLMRVTCWEVKLNIIECVKSFYQCASPRQLSDGPLPTPPGYRLQLLEHSDLSQTLVMSLATVQHRPDIKLQLLQALRLLSSSDLNCALMLRAQGAATICLHMNESDSSGPVLFHSTEILWNLLERGNKHQVMAQLSSIECLVSLKETFLHQLMTAVQQPELKLRNDLLVITTLICENGSTFLKESLFALLLTCLSTFPEIKPPSSLIAEVKLNYTHQDLKMKKMLLNLLCVMANDVAVLQLYREKCVILALLLNTRERQEKWSSAQTKELQVQALHCLCSLAPLLLDDYMNYYGNVFVLYLLGIHSQEDEASDQTLDISDHRKTLRHLSLRLLHILTSLDEETVIEDLCDQGAINDLLGLLMQIEGSCEEEDAIAVEMKSDIQLILSALCDTDMHRKELFGSEGVDTVVHFLKKGGDRFYSGLGHNKLILSTVDCVWSCIVGCYTTEDFFLAKSGVCLLLDLLCSSPKTVYGIILATLLELCDNPNTAMHLRTWRGSEGQTAPRVLLQIWRSEEAELGVQRDQDGCVTDPNKPISHKQQEDLRGLSPSYLNSAAILELEENLRSKIYSIFCVLGSHDLPGLAPEDYVTLSIIRRYLDFKVGEVWAEVSAELAQEGIRPVTPDQQSLESICEVSVETATRVLEEQASILQRQEKENLSQEQLLYSEMVSQTKSQQKEIAAKSWNDYVSKTSNYEVLKQLKAQRESSRPGTNSQENGIHPVKHFIGQVVSVDQTGAEAPEGVTVSVARVSMKSAGQNQVQDSPGQDPEYFRPVSVKH